MDFCKLLHKAQKNDKDSANGAPRYYSTKFEPPKKLSKTKPTTSKELSANVKKFLERKEAEERQKAEEAKKKKDDLLALRSQDKKAVKRVNVMLKSTKSANKSVIEDAVDNTNTAITMAGPDQPDEDDYGYVSQEASDLYSKMMEKYKSMPEEPKFKKFEKKVSTNLASTKDRVKAALEREKEEALHPHRRKRKRKENGEEKDDEDKKEDEDDSKSSKYEEKEAEAPVKPKPKPRPAAPPPLSFTDLLKIAEKKQFEPIIIPEKPKEDEKPLTKKQRKLAEQEREYRERKEARQREAVKPIGPSKLEARLTENPKSASKPQNPPLKPSDTTRPISSIGNTSKLPDKVSERDRDGFKKPLDQPAFRNTSQPSASGSTSKYSPNGAVKSSQNVPSKTKPGFSSASPNDRKPAPSSSNRSEPGSSYPHNRTRETESANKRPTEGQRPIERRPMDGQRRLEDQRRPDGPQRRPDGPPRRPDGPQRRPDGPQRRQDGPQGRPDGSHRRPDGPARRPDGPQKRQDEQRLPEKKTTESLKKRPLPLNPYMDPTDLFPMKNKAPPPKRRVLDDYDDEDEYDSELDDFIDDGPEDDAGYSSVIQEIFGYDKSRYRDQDDDVDNMETSFAAQMKEEVRSTKIGIMEDLEDIEKEKEEKRRKALMKKKMMRR